MNSNKKPFQSRIMDTFILRISFGYLGAIGLFLPLLPLASTSIYSAGGHSVMYLGSLAPLLGSFIGFIISDLIRKINPTAIILRAVVSIIVAIVFVLMLGQIQVNAFFVNQGWIFIGLLGPLVTGWTTEYVQRNSIQTQRQKIIER